MLLESGPRYPAYPIGFSNHGYDDDPDSHIDILFRSRQPEASSLQATRDAGNDRLERHPDGGKASSAVAGRASAA